MTKIIIAVAMAMLFAVSLTGCEEKGPVEKLGESVDEAVNDAARKVEDATD